MLKRLPQQPIYACNFCLACVMMSFLYVMQKLEVEEDYHDKGCDFNLFLAFFLRLKGRGIVLVHPPQES